MKLHINIHSYQRKGMLESLIKEIKDFQAKEIHEVSFSIIDDGSDFTSSNKCFHQLPHGGKSNFWKLFDYSLKLCKNIDADIYLFIPSDVSHIQFENIFKYHNKYKGFGRTLEAYCYNVTNDGRVKCWGNKRMTVHDEYSFRSYFTDCGFFCPRLTLEKLDFTIHPVEQCRFKMNPNISSGVGQQMTTRLNNLKVKMFIPKKSLCFHGDHDSLMHFEHRKKVPLLSK